MATTATLGFPRIGTRRQLKQALERHWSGELDELGFRAAAAAVRDARWARQRELGIAGIPSNDFSWYDHVLDLCCALGAVPARFGHGGGPVDARTYFRMARGGDGAAPLEMTKWFDTNYHYLVPELEAGTAFRADPGKPVAEFRAASVAGVRTRPVLVGPITFLRLAKRVDGGDALALLPAVLPAYAGILRALAEAGAASVQLDEPVLAADPDAAALAALPAAYRALADAAPGLGLHLATYFGGVGRHAGLLADLPLHGLHIDLARAPQDADAVLARWPRDRDLSLGLIDGRNIWRCDLRAALELAERIAARHPGGRLAVAPSCSLLHVPVDLDLEPGLDPAVRPWLAFASQKCAEAAILARGLSSGRASIAAELEGSDEIRRARAASPLAVRPAVRARLAAIAPADRRRASPVAERLAAQRRARPLPLFPTTTIGSFPQTAEVRRARAEHRAGRLADAAYDGFLRAETERCVRAQERLGLDVLVHGEFERNDMVEYFGERLAGFLATANGWVQSYGSRCVKPPIIAGDVARPAPMTVGWAAYARSLTDRPMKGMLTGPVTILQWSFVRDDLPRSQVADQIALALRDEVRDLEAAGIGIIQVDEPAFREGLPLRRDERDAYLGWAAGAFRLATAGAADETQIHTHMCYSEFNDIVPAIADLDADVISIETARSRMELLAAFERFRWPAEIGPGVYDIHAPAVPDEAAMRDLLRRACRVLRPDQVWVNPDCGLKTRAWPAVEEALRRMVAAARAARADQASPAGRGPK